MYEKPLMEEQEQGEGLLRPAALNLSVAGTLSSNTIGFILLKFT